MFKNSPLMTFLLHKSMPLTVTTSIEYSHLPGILHLRKVFCQCLPSFLALIDYIVILFAGSWVSSLSFYTWDEEKIHEESSQSGGNG